MDNAQTWVEALNISPESLSAWSDQVPPGKPLLVWCMEEGHVSVAEYLMWATEHFGLAVLSSAFFESGELDAGWFGEQRASGDWSPWRFPVGEWDGTLFIACTEPPEEAMAGHAYVLADPRAMQDLWGQDNSMVAAPADEPPPIDAPAGISLDAKPTFKLSLGDDVMLGGADHEPEVAPPAQVSENTAITRISTEPTRVSAKPILQLEDPVGDGEAPTLSDAPELVSTVTPADDADGLTSPDLAPATVVRHFQASAAAVNLDLPRQEAGALQKLFAHLNETYKGACVLRIKDAQASLHKADGTLKVNAAAVKMDLNFPSFLRILLKTGQPYHGYLVDTPTHREFFQALGQKELPGCVTAVPLRLENEIWGVLLALGPDTLQHLDNLAHVENAAGQLVNALSATWSRAA